MLLRKWLRWPNKVTIILIHIVVICVKVPCCSLIVGCQHSEESHCLHITLKKYQHFRRFSGFHFHGKMEAHFNTVLWPRKEYASSSLWKPQSLHTKKSEAVSDCPANSTAVEWPDFNWLCWDCRGFPRHFHTDVWTIGYGHFVPITQL
jgi:hypothetical protein